MGNLLRIDSYQMLQGIAEDLRGGKTNELSTILSNVKSTRDSLNIKFVGLAATNFSKAVNEFETAFNTLKQKLPLLADEIESDIKRNQQVDGNLGGESLNVLPQ